MAFIRSKKIKNNYYYYLVENKRIPQGGTRQHVIRYLGTMSPRGLLRLQSQLKSLRKARKQGKERRRRKIQKPPAMFICIHPGKCKHYHTPRCKKNRCKYYIPLKDKSGK